MEKAVNSLNAPFDIEELTGVIKDLPSGNAPGPDGLTYLYFKTFLPELAPYMLPLFNSILEGAQIPQSMSHAYITLNPKSGKDASECANYRPIALLNSSVENIYQALAKRLNFWLPHLVHKDQVEFVPCRQGGDNTRRAIDLIDVINLQNKEALLLGLDLGKSV